ncbi:MAG: DUF6350 family protein, partial [Candidatus Nanopelagicales bacterium]
PEGGRRQAWTRVMRSRADAVTERLSAPMASALAAGWSAVITLLIVGAVVIGAWIMGAGSGDVGSALDMTGTAWLVAHHIPVSIPGGSVSELPVGIVLLPGWLLWRAGSWAARRSGACMWRELRVGVAAAAGVYATFGLFLAGFTATDSASVEPLYALIGSGLFAVLAFGGGASWQAGLWPSLADRFTPTMRRRTHAAVTGFMALLAAAASLIAISLVVHFSTAKQMLAQLGPGLLGNVFLLLLGVAYLPNALSWAVGYLVGPGFAVGGTTSVSMFGVSAGALPAFPLFAAVPGSAAPWAPALLVFPLIAGGLAVKVLHRDGPLPIRSVASLRERVWVAGIAAGAVLVLCVVGGGGLGSGRLAMMGPSAIPVALATFALFIVGGLLTDVGRSLRRWRSRRTMVDVTDQPAEMPKRSRLRREFKGQ